ncbi:MAG TPA: hypothetical protein VFS19_01285 [Planctomycetota bacterium]|nr:hypothetical protein [Planctomycetota bacterium]
MIAILLLALLQDRPVEASIEAFLKGDAAAKAEIVKLGAYAIRPLQKAREKAPEKINALVFELKKAAASPAPDRFDADFNGTRGISGSLHPRVINALARDLVPCFLDSFDPARLKSTGFRATGTSVLELMEAVCTQTGLDFGYFHNSIILAHPDRLWPSLGAPDKGELKGASLERAKALVEKLGDEMLGAREEASRDLLNLGRGVVPVLQAQLQRSEAEIVARCRSLLSELLPKEGAFGPPAACRQALDDAGRALLKKLSGSKVNLRVDGQNMGRIVEILNASQTVKLGIQAEAAKRTITFEVWNMPVMDLLSLVTQTQDLDFMIQGDGVFIDDREAIHKLVPKSK